VDGLRAEPREPEELSEADGQVLPSHDPRPIPRARRRRSRASRVRSAAAR
jgi:hypothetical protein